VGHDFDAQIAYSYAAAHPTEVKKLVVMTMNIPGFIPTGKVPSWWSVLHQTRDLPEACTRKRADVFIMVL
jgi:pimeloyl-ACP methyl ester carboxylesterase